MCVKALFVMFFTVLVLLVYFLHDLSIVKKQGGSGSDRMNHEVCGFPG